MLAPLLTEWDPLTSSEGSIDPLGLYGIADSLGVRLVPGVRERQQHPRFLTATAVSLAVCGGFGPDAVAADGVSEPQMVFEWHVVEGMMRSLKAGEQLRGLPGREKVNTSIRNKVPLSAKNYLKTANVFGFHGVYRLLANSLGVEQVGRLGENGYQLLDVWRKEQRLPGFYETADGDGAQLYRRITDAVRDGLEQGAVARPWNWPTWSFFGEHLRPDSVGRKEAQVITNLLLAEAGGYRRNVLEFVTSDQGQKIARAIFEKQSKDGIWNERPLHLAMRRQCRPDLGELLDAITAYETFARLLTDAFDDCLRCLSVNHGKVTPATLAKEKHVTKACQEVPAAFSEAMEKLMPVGQATSLQQAFSALSERAAPQEWVQLLLDHHRHVQQAKPPNGKLPWFERFEDGSCMIRTGYRRETSGRGDNSYVHTYRLGSLWSFASDLRLVN